MPVQVFRGGFPSQTSESLVQLQVEPIHCLSPMSVTTFHGLTPTTRGKNPVIKSVDHLTQYKKYKFDHNDVCDISSVLIVLHGKELVQICNFIVAAGFTYCSR